MRGWRRPAAWSGYRRSRREPRLGGGGPPSRASRFGRRRRRQAGRSTRSSVATWAHSTHARRTPEPNAPPVRKAGMDADDIKFGLPVRDVHVPRTGIIALATGGIMPFQHEHQPLQALGKVSELLDSDIFCPGDQAVPMDLSTR